MKAVVLVLAGGSTGKQLRSDPEKRPPLHGTHSVLKPAHSSLDCVHVATRALAFRSNAL
jgi:hypothetical protein